VKNKLFVILLSIIFLSSCKKNDANTITNISQPFQAGSSLAVSSGRDMEEPRIVLSPDTVYSNIAIGPMFKAIPIGYEDKIASFYLPKGYMAVFAENSDGTGASSYYVASQSPIKINFGTNLSNKISFIRYIAIGNLTKKGVAFVDSNVVKQFNTSWYYGWSLNRPSYGSMNYVPMTWGKTSATLANVNYFLGRKDINHLLSFNEPDNPGQSNMPVDTAISKYRLMMQTGLRLGSPAVEQDNSFVAGRWLPNFMDATRAQKLRVDYICLHWYDWGNENNNRPTDSLTAEAVFNRFKTFVERVKVVYPDQKIWLTEYNCNPSRNARPVVIKYFMKLSTDWMNSTAYIERYAYFQQKTDAVDSNGLLNDLAIYWNNITSPIVFPLNIE
jgi:Glycosyl hydrolase catalytic core